MRKISKNFDAIPPELQAAFYEDKLLHEQLLTKKENHGFKESIYNHSIIDNLRVLYHDKCAFCETKIPSNIQTGKFRSGKGTVEHYRPKKGGYYWLGYEWSNLFLACDKCNSNKGDKFELISPQNKQKNPPLILEKTFDFSKFKANCPELLAENPSLLHPEIDEGRDYFTIQRNGEIKALPDLLKTKTRRANYTIDCVKLNRWELVENRKKMIDDLLFDIENQLLLLLKYSEDGHITDKELLLTFSTTFSKIAAINADISEFTLLGQNIWELLFADIMETQGESSYNLLIYARKLFIHQFF